MSHDPEHASPEEPTRATPRIDPSMLDKQHTQEFGGSGTREVPYGTPPPDLQPSYGQGYGYPPAPEQPYSGGGYDQQANADPYAQYGQTYGQTYGQQYGQSYGQQPSGQPGQPYGGDPYAQYSQQYGQQYGQSPYSNPYGYGPVGGYPQPESNGLAIAALVTSLSGVLCGVGFVVGLILGIIALPKAKRQGNGGAMGMAIAGIVIGAIGVLGIVAYVAWMVNTFDNSNY